MRKLNLPGSLLIVVLLGSLPLLATQREDILRSMPRVDVHTHIAGDFQLMDRYVELGNILKEQYAANLEVWIDLGSIPNQRS